MKNRFTALACIALPCLAAAPLAQANDGETLFGEVGCSACHAVDQKRLGPSFKDVAAKYKGQADAQDKLVNKVRSGGSGVWGTAQMPAHPPERVTDEELHTLIAWVLSH